MEFVVLLCAASNMDAEDDQPHFARLMQVSKYLNLSIPALVITSNRLQADPYVQTFSHVVRDYSDRVYVECVLRRQALERVLSVWIRTIVILPEELQRNTPVLDIDALHDAFGRTYRTVDAAMDYALVADEMFSQILGFSKLLAEYIREYSQLRAHANGNLARDKQHSRCEFMSLVSKQLCEMSHAYDAKAKPHTFPTRRAGCSIACVNTHLIRIYLTSLSDWAGVDPVAKSELYFRRARIHVEMVCPANCSVTYGIPLFKRLKENDTLIYQEQTRYDSITRTRVEYPEWPVYTLLICRHLAEIINDMRSCFRRDWFLLALSLRARDSGSMLLGHPV
jgi:hypothetical protein